MTISFFAGDEVLRAIDNLASRRHRTFEGEHEFTDILREKEFVARELARAISRREFRADPASARVIRTGEKDRTIFRSTAIDAIVERVLAQFLQHALEPFLSPHVHSYRKGKSERDTLRAFTKFVRRHRAEHTDPKARGLFVLRRDIKSYGESIRVDDASHLWALLHRALAASPQEDRETAIFLLKQFLPRDYVDVDGTKKKLLVGTPTGSAFQPVLNNLYLTDVDAEFAKHGFYARFGDDILFASDDMVKATSVAGELRCAVESLSLTFGTDKSRDIFFNGAARNGEAPFVGADVVEYLGVALSFRGVVHIRQDKWHVLLRALHERMRRSVAGNDVLSIEERAARIGAVTRAAFDVRDPLALTEASSLLHLVDDRSQLRALDRSIVLYAAELATKRRGVRAFRELPPKRLYELGLHSCIGAKHRRDHGRPVK